VILTLAALGIYAVDGVAVGSIIEADERTSRPKLGTHSWWSFRRSRQVFGAEPL